MPGIIQAPERLTSASRPAVDSHSRGGVKVQTGGDQRLIAHLDTRIGASVNVRMQRGGRGRSPDFSEIAIDRPAGTIVHVRVTDRHQNYLRGEALA
jgi:hypothetical protein